MVSERYELFDGVYMFPPYDGNNWYSPVPDVEELKKRRVFDSNFDITLIPGWDADKLFERKERYASLPLVDVDFDECDMRSIVGIIDEFKPTKIAEFGCGRTSEILNKCKPDGCQYVVINPGYGVDYAESVNARAEFVDPTSFDLFVENDIIFIDTTHVIRQGGDINHLYLKIIPYLNPGVIVHSHDISLPHEYPECYAERGMFWTEQYLLFALLVGNPDFEVLYSCSFLHGDGSSFWFRKVLK